MNEKNIEENHENSHCQINAISENEYIPMYIYDKGTESTDDESKEGINDNNKININFENNTMELLKSKRTNKFYNGWLKRRIQGLVLEIK